MVDFLPCLQAQLLCFSVQETSSEKRSTLKGKNLLPLVANSFLVE